jgi:hypothetical protein
MSRLLLPRNEKEKMVVKTELETELESKEKRELGRMINSIMGETKIALRSLFSKP